MACELRNVRLSNLTGFAYWGLYGNARDTMLPMQPCARLEDGTFWSTDGRLLTAPDHYAPASMDEIVRWMRDNHVLLRAGTGLRVLWSAEHG